MNRHKILIADDHQVVIDGLKEMLSGQEQMEICGEILDPDKLTDSLYKTVPDLLILDINMQEANMLKSVPDLKKQFPTLKIIIFTSYNTPSLWKEAKKLGVDAFLPKNTGKEKLIQTILQILSITTTPSDFSKESTTSKSVAIMDGFAIQDLLSKRELEVLKLVAEGNTSQQIAATLFISKHTVQWHRKKIIAKLNLNSASDLIRIAFDNGLI